MRENGIWLKGKKGEIQEGEITLTTVKRFLKNNGRYLNSNGLLTKLQKTKDDGVTVHHKVILENLLFKSANEFIFFVFQS